tara:strand:+ start:316 stop:1638 length:1323 start_codon:yes stop_codon:yes gene_type:complete
LIETPRDFVGHAFIWWTGVVEDVNDPLKLGRCRVRILGYHTDEKKDIKTEDLPWSYPMQSITSAAISGVGYSPTGLVPGSWVVGFFRDGASAQDAIIMGSLGGIPEEAGDQSKGFADPRKSEDLDADPKDAFKTQEYYDDGKGSKLENEEKAKLYPKEKALNEADTNRLARNEKVSETIVQLKKDNQDKDVPKAFQKKNGVSGEGPAKGGNPRSSGSYEEKWTEPNTPYAAVYPHNHVYESESGHTFEVDDTPGAERLHQYHRSGTFEEIHPDGSRVTKVVKDDYEIILKDKHVHIEGKATVTVDKGLKLLVNKDAEGGNNIDIQVGAKSHVNVELDKGDLNYTLHDGNLNGYINGDYTLDITGNMTERIGKERFSHSGKDTHFKTDKSYLTTAAKNIIEKAGGYRTSNAGKYTNIVSGATHLFKSSSSTVIKGSTVAIN